MSERTTLTCPWNPAWTLVCDQSEVIPEDPGAGTPAMIYGPNGSAGTYGCVRDVGEITDAHGREIPVPANVARWLDQDPAVLAALDSVGCWPA